jgi:predicted  nucleic acid-binding Zn-ribbon protein
LKELSQATIIEQGKSIRDFSDQLNSSIKVVQDQMAKNIEELSLLQKDMVENFSSHFEGLTHIKDIDKSLREIESGSINFQSNVEGGIRSVNEGIKEIPEKLDKALSMEVQKLLQSKNGNGKSETINSDSTLDKFLKWSLIFGLSSLGIFVLVKGGIFIVSLF